MDLLGWVKGKHGANGSAVARGADDVKRAVKLVHALANSGDSDAEGHAGGRFRDDMEDAYAVVLDFDGNGLVVAFDVYGSGRGARMAVDVGERFLGDTKDGKFRFFLDAAKILGNVNLNRNATAFRKKFGVGAQRDGEAGLFEKGRMQERRNEADFANGGAGQISRGLDQLVNPSVAARHGAADLGEGHFQGGKRLRSGLVEFAAHAALLFATNGE